MTLIWASSLDWNRLPNTGLENFEGLNAYKKLVRKELLNTVRTNRVDLDTLVSAICHLAMCACQLQDFPCLIACVRMGSIGRRLKFEGGMIEKYSTVMYKDAAPVRTPTSICACSHSQHTALRAAACHQIVVSYVC